MINIQSALNPKQSYQITLRDPKAVQLFRYYLKYNSSKCDPFYDSPVLFQNLYIMSKLPVLSFGITCKIILKIRKQIQRERIMPKTLNTTLTSFQLWLKKMKPPAASSTSMNKIMRNEYCSKC
jgi:hypothetical protein